jgi:tetratricopeptide (TPR) repeat protein
MPVKYFNLIVVFIFLTFSAKSDQLDFRLPNLFVELYESVEENQTNLITRKIWDIWLETNDLMIEADFYQGIESMRFREYKKSIVFFTRVIQKNPNFAEAWNKRATVYFIIGDFDKSMHDINETLKLEPRHFGAMDGMGLIFMNTKQYGNALRIYDQMLKIFPNNQNTKNKKKLMKELLLKST